MGPAEHDEVLAYTSHLPHALAGALASSVPADWLPLAAGAYRDGTRVAAADTGLWTAIFRDNRGPLLKALDSLRERLATFQYALMTDDEDAIRRWWDEGRLRRGCSMSSPESQPRLSRRLTDCHRLRTSPGSLTPAVLTRLIDLVQKVSPLFLHSLLFDI